MTVDRMLLDLMTETVQWTTGTTTNAYGVTTFSTSQHPMIARITYRHGETSDRTGRRVETRGVMWCANDSTHASTAFVPRVEDRLRLPDGTYPPIVNVETFYDENHVHHHRVTFGY